MNKTEIEVNDGMKESVGKWLYAKQQAKEAEAELFDVFWENTK